MRQDNRKSSSERKWSRLHWVLYGLQVLALSLRWSGAKERHIQGEGMDVSQVPPTCLVLVLLLQRMMLKYVLCFYNETEPKEVFCHQVRLAFANFF